MTSKIKSLIIPFCLLVCSSTLFTQCACSLVDDNKFEPIEYSTPKDLQLLVDENNEESYYIFTDIKKSNLGYGIWTNTIYHTLEAQSEEAEYSELKELPYSQNIYYVIDLDESKIAPMSVIWYDANGKEIQSAEIAIDDLEWTKIIPGTLGALFSKCIKDIISDNFEYEINE